MLASTPSTRALVLCALGILLLGPAPAAGVPADNTCLGLEGGPGDLDGDGTPAGLDCDDADPAYAVTPGEALDLDLEKLALTEALLSWSPPLAGGPVSYDLFRSNDPSGGFQCIAPQLAGPAAGDPDVPLPGQVFYYLPQPRNPCGEGDPGSGTFTARGPLFCDCSLVCDDGDSCTQNSCGAGTCLNPVRPPDLLRGPDSGATCAGGVARFSVLAAGSGPLSYQWSIDGLPAGLDMPVLVLSSVSASDDGAQVQVVVTDGCASATSAPATLHVFADVASCAGGLDGFEALNDAGAATPGERAYSPNPKAGGVHLHSGEFTLRHVDLTIPGRGFDFEWARTYRSRESLDSAMGRQWTHSYDRRVELDPASPGDLLLHDGSMARVDRYAPDPSAPLCWSAPGHFRTLCEQPDGRFVLTFADKHEWIFLPLDGSPGEGRIEASVDRNGNAMLFQYEPTQGRLELIVDTLDRPIEILHDPDGWIEALVDFTGRRWSYEHYLPLHPFGEPGDLLSATSPIVTGVSTGNDFPDGKTTTYTYTTGFADDALNHNLLTITDPLGQTYLTNVFAPTTSPSDGRFDRLDHQILPGGTVSYMYVQFLPDPMLPAIVSTTIVNDRAGNIAHYSYDAQHRLLRGRRFTGRAADPASPTDASQNAPGGPLRTTDPASFDTVRLYNNDFLPTQILMPNGNEIDLQYDSANPDPRLRGNLVQRIRFPGPLGGDQTSILESWGYLTDFGTLRGLGGGTGSGMGTLLHGIGGGTGSGMGTLRLGGSPLPTNGFPDVCQTPAPAGPIPIPYPNTTMTATSGGNCTVMVTIKKKSGGSGGGGSPGGAGGGGRIALRAFPTSYTDGRLQTYSNTYDPQGNLKTQQAPGPQLILDQFDYNGFGQMIRHTTAAGRVDTYNYHPPGPQAGYLSSVIVDEPGLALTTSYTYDPVGNVMTLIDPRGNPTQFIYNSLDQQVQVTSSPPFLFNRYVYYDANDNLVRTDVDNVDEDGSVDPNAFLTSETEYDLLDRATRVEDELGPGGACIANTFEYDANDNRAVERHGEATNGNDPANLTRSIYDERDLLFEVKRGDGGPDVSTTRYDYDPNGNTSAVRQGTEDPGGSHDAQYQYDGYDRLTRTIDAESNETVRVYDANGNPIETRVDDGDGTRLFEEACVYDEIDRKVRSDVEHFEIATGNPIGDGLSTTQYFFDPDSRFIRITDDNNHQTQFTYDSARRPSSVIDARGNLQSYTYDAGSNLTTVTDEELSDLGAPPQTYVTTYDFDSLDRAASVIDNLGGQWLYGYDSRDNLTRTVDAQGNVTRQTYDGLDRLTRSRYEMTDNGTGAGSVIGTIDTRICWDDSHRATCRIDGNGNRTDYAYDALDRLVETTHEDGTTDCVIWDVHDTPVERHDANGTLELRTYDALHRLRTNTTLPGTGVAGPTVESYTYDGLSRRRDADDDDTTTDLAYDSLSNLVEEAQQVGSGPVRVTSHLYDGASNRVETTYPSGRVVTRTFDELDRVRTVNSNGSPAATYDFVGSERVEQITRPNGVTTTVTYDGLRRPQRRTHDEAGVPLVDFDTTWDPMHNLSELADLLPGGESRQYAYDSAYRLVGSTRLPSGQPPAATEYALDDAGNRTTVTGGPDAGAYTQDPADPPADAQANQYTSTPQGPRSYDENGNLLSSGLLSGVVYDHRNQMVQASDAGGNVHQYRYDALGRRVETDVNLGTQIVRYYWNENRVIEEQDASDAARATYVYGGYLDERLQLHEETDLDGDLLLETYWYHDDYRHNVRALTGDTGLLVESYTYDDYGRPQVSDAGGGAIGSKSALGNPYLFSGRRWDDLTELYHWRHRYLDPHAGRYTTPRRRDPLDGVLDPENDFGFGGSNPVTWPPAFRGKGASSAADAVGASGYSKGDDVHFGPGKYEPDSAAGKDLLGHELVHTQHQAEQKKKAPPQGVMPQPVSQGVQGPQGIPYARGTKVVNVGHVGHVDHGKTTLTSSNPNVGVIRNLGVKFVPGIWGNRKRKELCESIGGTWHGRLFGIGDCEREPFPYIRVGPGG